jgi:hypothetical protein
VCALLLRVIALLRLRVRLRDACCCIHCCCLRCLSCVLRAPCWLLVLLLLLAALLLFAIFGFACGRDHLSTG